MAETKKKNKKKKVTVSEEDMSMLLQRYSATVIVKLLQEVAQLPDVKFDWNEVVKKTSTGITNAREYQMIWRHLAYRDTLLENVDEGMEPLNDDSDLETDMESVPPISTEASAEAEAFAKVLIGSRLPRNPGPLNRLTIEGPLTINIPNVQSFPVASDNPQPAYTQEKNIIVSVVVPKEKDGGGSKACPAKGKKREDEDKDKDTHGATGTNKRKRKQWTEQEDMELIAAVQKCGERNWANILKGDFKGDRTASQLSQRWAILRKKQANLGGAGNQLSEAQLATRRAVSHALNMPMVDNLLAACSVGATQSSIPSSSAALPCAPEDISAGAQTQQASRNKGISTSTSKPKVIAVKGPTVPFKPLLGSDPMIQAAAVAAGARIANPSTAASLIKAAQSKNVVHFRPAGCSMIKTSLPGATKPAPTNHLGVRPKVHYIRTGLAPASAPPTYSSPGPNIPHSGSIQQEPENSTKQQMVTGSLPLSTASSTVVLTSSSSTTLCEAEETKIVEDLKSEELKEDVPGNVSKEVDGQVDPKSEVLTENHASTMENMKQITIVDAGENKQLVSKQSESSAVVKTETCSTAMDGD